MQCSFLKINWKTSSENKTWNYIQKKYKLKLYEKTTYLKTLLKIIYLEFDLNKNSKFDKYAIGMSWKRQIQNRIKTLNQ